MYYLVVWFQLNPTTHLVMYNFWHASFWKKNVAKYYRKYIIYLGKKNQNKQFSKRNFSTNFGNIPKWCNQIFALFFSGFWRKTTPLPHLKVKWSIPYLVLEDSFVATKIPYDSILHNVIIHFLISHKIYACYVISSIKGHFRLIWSCRLIWFNKSCILDHQWVSQVSTTCGSDAFDAFRSYFPWIPHRTGLHTMLCHLRTGNQTVIYTYRTVLTSALVDLLLV